MIYRQFFEKYDPSEKLTFDNVEFRKGAAFTLGWDIYINPDFLPGRTFYFHPANDRGDPTHENIFNPFDCYGNLYENVPGYGTVFVGTLISGDFIFRIAHIELTKDIKKMIDEHTIIPGKVFLGKIKAEEGFAAHSHLEIVSICESSEICDYIIQKKQKTNYDILKEVLDSPRISGSIKVNIVDYCMDRRIDSMTNFSLKRTDGMNCAETHSKLVTYYNSRELFGL